VRDGSLPCRLGACKHPIFLPPHSAGTPLIRLGAARRSTFPHKGGRTAAPSPRVPPSPPLTVLPDISPRKRGERGRRCRFRQSPTLQKGARRRGQLLSPRLRGEMPGRAMRGGADVRPPVTDPDGGVKPRRPPSPAPRSTQQKSAPGTDSRRRAAAPKAASTAQKSSTR